MRYLCNKKRFKVFMLLSCFFLMNKAAYAGEFGTLWKKLIKDPKFSHSCKGQGKKLFGLSNESASESIFIKIFDSAKSGEKKVIPSRELKVGQRGNLKLDSGAIMVVCSDFDSLAVKVRRHRAQSSQKLCDTSADNCFIKISHQSVYTFKKESKFLQKVLNAGKFRFKKEKATQKQLLEFPRYLSIYK